MINHKWKDTTILTNISKNQECEKCGISRAWCYAPYNCWEYHWTEPFIAMNGEQGLHLKKSFKRPNCISSGAKTKTNCG